MNYRAAGIPLDGEPLECSKDQLREYFAWYMANRNQRIERLQVLVRLESATRAWKPDLSRDSLTELDRWLVRNVTMRRVPVEEQDHLEFHGRTIRLGPTSDLSEASVAHMYDVGVYLGAVLHHACPWLIWKQELRARLWSHYGHPVLAGFAHRMVFEPFHMAQVQGYKVGRTPVGPKGLDGLHDVWAQLAAEARSDGKSG